MSQFLSNASLFQHEVVVCVSSGKAVADVVLQNQGDVYVLQQDHREAYSTWTATDRAA